MAWNESQTRLSLMRVIIAGGRDFDDYDLLCRKCDNILKHQMEVIVVCGMCQGADLLGKRYAEEWGFKVDEHPVTDAEWYAKGKRAGYDRNVRMALNADALSVLGWAKNKNCQWQKTRIRNLEHDRNCRSIRTTNTHYSI